MGKRNRIAICVVRAESPQSPDKYSETSIKPKIAKTWKRSYRDTGSFLVKVSVVFCCGALGLDLNLLVKLAFLGARLARADLLAQLAQPAWNMFQLF